MLGELKTRMNTGRQPCAHRAPPPRRCQNTSTRSPP
jgi:hypothetical protein